MAIYQHVKKSKEVESDVAEVVQLCAQLVVPHAEMGNC